MKDHLQGTNSILLQALKFVIKAVANIYVYNFLKVGITEAIIAAEKSVDRDFFTILHQAIYGVAWGNVFNQAKGAHGVFGKMGTAVVAALRALYEGLSWWQSEKIREAERVAKETAAGRAALEIVFSATIISIAFDAVQGACEFKGHRRTGKVVGAVGNVACGAMRGTAVGGLQGAITGGLVGGLVWGSGELSASLTGGLKEAVKWLWVVCDLVGHLYG